jgi:hypothetical protein
MIPDSIRALPCWRGEIAAEPLHGGLSNESWKVTDAAGAHVVRFGRDYPFHHVDRAREVMTAHAAHAAGFGPAVEYAAPGVSVGQFITAATWTPADVSAAPDRVGALLRRFHHEMPTHIAGAGFIFWPFHVIRDYARTIAAGGSPFAPDLSNHLALAAKLEAARDHPEASRLFALEVMQGAPMLSAVLATDLKELVDRKVALLQRWQAEGRLKPHKLLELSLLI